MLAVLECGDGGAGGPASVLFDCVYYLLCICLSLSLCWVTLTVLLLPPVLSRLNLTCERSNEYIS